MRAHILLVALCLVGVFHQADSFLTNQHHHQSLSSSQQPATTSNLFRQPERNDEKSPGRVVVVGGKRQRLKQLVSRAFRETRLKVSILLMGFALMQGPNMAQAAVATRAPAPTQAGQLKAQAANTISENKGGVAVTLGAGTGLVIASTRKKRTTDEGDDDSSELLEKEVMGAADGTVPLAELPPVDSSEETSSAIVPVEEDKRQKQQTNVEMDKAILEALDAIGANPDAVYGFLGSSLAFMVSHDFLVSGIAFAWIYDLFQDKKKKDDLRALVQSNDKEMPLHLIEDIVVEERSNPAQVLEEAKVLVNDPPLHTNGKRVEIETETFIPVMEHEKHANGHASNDATVADAAETIATNEGILSTAATKDDMLQVAGEAVALHGEDDNHHHVHQQGAELLDSIKEEIDNSLEEKAYRVVMDLGMLDKRRN
eukprot:scaffold2004_cov101-Cylindrotheca_fusiformis.AAC.4